METVTIPKTEYIRLKKLNKRFEEFWAYLEHITEIKEAREEVKKKKVISQEKLFKNLGL